MKGYTRSYIMGSIFIVLAFVTLFVDIKGMPSTKDKTGSWVLFLGGAVLVTVGWREQNKKPKDKES